jgi:hypothetical protein
MNVQLFRIVPVRLDRTVGCRSSITGPTGSKKPGSLESAGGMAGIKRQQEGRAEAAILYSVIPYIDGVSEMGAIITLGGGGRRAFGWQRRRPLTCLQRCQYGVAAKPSFEVRQVNAPARLK